MNDSVDLSRLKDTSEGDREFEAELIAMFLEDVTAMVATLPNHLEKGDFLALYQASHALKGTCANMGAHEMQALAAVIEKAAMDRQAEEASARIAPMSDALERTRLYFHEYVQSFSPDAG